jgi:hypothetical protein
MASMYSFDVSLSGRAVPEVIAFCRDVLSGMVPVVAPSAEALDVIRGHGLHLPLATTLEPLLDENESRMLRDETRSAVLAGLQIAAWANQTLKLLRDASIDAVVFKGVSVGTLAYGSLGRRHIGDIDLLVHPANAAAALRLLISSGYSVQTGIHNDADVEMHLRSGFEFELNHPTRPQIDLHFRLAPAFIATGDVDVLLRYAVPITVGNIELPTLAAPAHAVALAVNGAKNSWPRLEQLYTFARVLQLVSIAEVEAIAKKHHVERMTRLSLMIVRLLGWWDGPVRESTFEKERARHWVHQLLDTGETPRLSVAESALYLSDRASSGFLSLLRFGVSPTAMDSTMLALTPGLRWMYPFLRPFRFVYSRLSRKGPLSTKH